MSDFPKVLSMGDVERELGVSRPRINELVRQGKLSFQETSAGKIFLASDVAALKKERQKRAKDDTRIKRGR